MKNLSLEQIIAIKNLTVQDLLNEGFNIEDLFHQGLVMEHYYKPSDSLEYYDGGTFYNKSGQPLKDPSHYDPNTEGYTPYGDE